MQTYNWRGTSVKEFFSLIGSWKFDPISSVVTLLVVPTGLYVAIVLRRFLKDAVNDVYNLEKCFDIYANTTGLLVVLDGLDEVSSSNYPRVAAAINAISVKLQQLGENSVIVLTLRTQFHHQTRMDFDHNFPTVLSVKRFTPSRAAANALSSRAERPWAENINSVPMKDRWSNSGCYPDSFYIDCISLGCHAHLDLASTPLLNILRRIPSPNSVPGSKVLRLCVKYRGAAFAALYFGTAIAGGLVSAWGSQPLFVIGASIGGLALFGISAISISVGSRFQLYLTLLRFGVNPFLSPAHVMQEGIRKLINRQHKILPIAPFVLDEAGEVRWAHFLRHGPFRSLKLIEFSRELILKRDPDGRQRVMSTG